MLITYIYILLSFLQLGALGYGGQEAWLAYLQHEVVDLHQWLSPGQFSAVVALGQVAPGGLPASAAVVSAFAALAGKYGTAYAALGSLLGIAALAAPSLFFAAIADKAKALLNEQNVGKLIGRLLRLAVAGIATAGVLLLLNADNFGLQSQNPWQFWISIFLFVFTLVGIAKFRFHPVFMLLLSGIAGWLLL